MLPPVDASGNAYPYPPVAVNPSGAPNNAYAAPPRGQVFPGQNVPTTIYGDPFATPLGGVPSPSTDTLSGRIPDPMQQGQVPIRTEFPPDGTSPSDWYLGVNGPARDTIQRHTVEGWQSVPYDVNAPAPFEPSPNPRWQQYPEGGRLTSRNSPNSFYFTRPFDQSYERRLNGRHFSMADHRRNYPVFGMSPAKTWRNTSRVDPTPWDANIVDTVSGPRYEPGPNIPHYEAPMNSQQWVLGG